MDIDALFAQAVDHDTELGLLDRRTVGKRGRVSETYRLVGLREYAHTNCCHVTARMIALFIGFEITGFGDAAIAHHDCRNELDIGAYRPASQRQRIGPAQADETVGLVVWVDVYNRFVEAIAKAGRDTVAIKGVEVDDCYPQVGIAQRRVAKTACFVAGAAEDGDLGLYFIISCSA